MPASLSHRADYIDVLLEETRRLGVAIKLDSEVEYVDFETPWLRLVNGQVYHADVIIGCDGTSNPPETQHRDYANVLVGVHSKIRTQLHPSIQPQHGGSFAYRVLFTPSQLSSPTLQHILTTRSCRLWLGPQVHAVFYPVRNGATFNLVFIVADAELNARCQGGDSLAPMREWMADWDPALREMLAVATELARFPLLELEELPSWGRGCVAVMGDAAHPMLPYLGQGAAIAVEDAAILGTLLGRLTQHASWQGRFRNHHIPAILTAYAAIQRPRAALVVAQSREQGSFNHLAPGTAAQRERDAEYAAFDWGACVSRSGWVDAAFNRELLGRRAVDVAEDMFGVMLRDAAFGDFLEKIPCVSEQAIYEPAEDTVCKL